MTSPADQIAQLQQQVADLTAQIAVLNAQIAALTMQLADVDVTVFASMIDGAVVALAPAGTTLVGSPDGLAIKATGDIYIDDSVAFFDALPLVAETSGDSYGFTLGAVDYYDYDQHADHMVLWFDGVDQSTLIVNEDDVVDEWACKINPDRKARNDAYPGVTRKPTYKRVSANGRPGVSFDPPGQSVYGLYFEGAPSYAGCQRVQYMNSNRMESRWDKKYDPNVLAQPKSVWPGMNGAAPTIGRMNALTLIADKVANNVSFRLNGLSVSTEPIPTNLYPFQLDYDGICCVVFYPDASGISGASQIFSQAALGQSTFEWKGSAYKGDIYEIISMINVTPLS